ncbi:MAG: winged helix-turn-helix transcriptional regulator [Planctomycetota bacterium]|jgi:DNA-binding MarR family transcriptional regulator
MKKEFNNFQILKAIEEDASVSQRKLSSQMELNVSSVNVALQNLVKRGFVKKVGENTRRSKYYITPEGMREKTHLAYKFYCRNIPCYKEVRNDIETRILEATNGKTDITIYGTSEFSEIVYMVVSKMGLNFLGFYLDGSKITNEKILGYSVQRLTLLKRNQKCLLLLTETFPADKMNDLDTKNVDILNLVDYIAVILN